MEQDKMLYKEISKITKETNQTKKNEKDNNNNESVNKATIITYLLS